MPDTGGREVFHIRQPGRGKPGRWLLLNHPSIDELANLTNTCGAGTKGNNARMTLSPRPPYTVRLKSTRPIADGEEILTAYGWGYSLKMNRLERKGEEERKERFVGGGWWTCGKCDCAMREGKREMHETQFGGCRGNKQRR